MDNVFSAKRGSARVRLGLRQVAARQSGVVRFQQGLRFGRSKEVAAELGGELWVRLERGLYLLRGARFGDEAKAWAAFLHSGPGVAVSHFSAAAMWGRAGYQTLPLHTWRMRGANSIRSSDRLKVHETRVLPPEHLAEIDGLAVTRPARTVIDLAAKMPFKRTEALLDRFWADRMVAWPELLSTFEALDQRGRRGIREMRALLDARGEHYVPPASGLERRAQDLLGRHGVTGLRRQVVLSDGPTAARVDFLHPSSRVVIEVQSDRWHASLFDRERDRLRTDQLQRLGYIVVEIWESQLFGDAYDWAESIADLIRRRSQRAA